uniref:Uncharacterized protein n=1 Tax=Panagrolaimus superbus TaxID=310955 RepID=A0A914YPT0_9BILA
MAKWASTYQTINSIKFVFNYRVCCCFGYTKKEMGFERFVDFSVGQRIICKSEKFPNHCSIWRFEKALDDDNDHTLFYRCSTCQADVNDLKEEFGMDFSSKVPILRVKEDGKLLDDPDAINGHICKWETSEYTEEGRAHARRLIMEFLMDSRMPLDAIQIRQKLKEAKKDQIFAYMNPDQKANAADIFRQFSLNDANKWIEWAANSMEVSPITIAQRDVTPPRPSLSRWQSTLSLFSPSRKKTNGSVTSLFSNLFKTPK